MGGSIRINPCGLLCLGIVSLLILYYTFGRTDNREKISIKVLLSASIDIAKKGGYQVKTIREKNNVSMYYTTSCKSSNLYKSVCDSYDPTKYKMNV